MFGFAGKEITGIIVISAVVAVVVVFGGTYAYHKFFHEDKGGKMASKPDASPSTPATPATT